MQTYDKLWKGIIEDLFDDFLYFFFPKWTHQIDFEKNFEFLDQELAQLFPELEDDDRAIDKLVKVHLKDGAEEWLLVHVEVQGYEDKKFSERMFTYNYRILDRYKKRISALAIFTDSKKNYKPSFYHSECFGTTIDYHFSTYKVLEQNDKELEKSENPFAIVILATLAAIKKGKKSDFEIMDIKRYLAKLLYERKYTKKKIISLFKFIQIYIRFEKSENYGIFAEEITSIYESKVRNMGVVEIIIEDALQEGLKKGIEQGDYKRMVSVIEKILISFPEWEDEKIADLSGANIDLVKEIRSRFNQ